MVDVTHDRDHGRPQLELARIGLFFLEDVALERTDLDVEVEFVCDQLGRRGIQDLVDRGHDTQLEERLDHLARFVTHGCGQLADRHGLRQLDQLALDLDRRLGRAGPLLRHWGLRFDLDLGWRGRRHGRRGGGTRGNDGSGGP